MVALRLFIAEDLITKHDDKIAVDNKEKSAKAGADRSDEASTASGSASVELAHAKLQANLQLDQSIISEQEAWRYLQRLGCTWRYIYGYRVLKGKDQLGRFGAAYSGQYCHGARYGVSQTKQIGATKIPSMAQILSHCHQARHACV
jgi:hypothetical protein